MVSNSKATLRASWQSPERTGRQAKEKREPAQSGGQTVTGALSPASSAGEPGGGGKATS